MMAQCNELENTALSTIAESDGYISQAKSLVEKMQAPIQTQNRAKEAQRRVIELKRRVGLLPAQKTYQIDFGHCTIQGRRPNNEDAHLITTVEKNGRRFLLAAVFDGHAGDAAANYCAQHFAQNLQQADAFPAEPGAALSAAFVRTDAVFCEATKVSGCTAAALLYELGTGALWAANAGDARVVYGDKGAVVEATHDHKPINPAERARIEQAGSFVSVIFGVSRVNGMLAVSRAIGDDEYKQFGVTAEPEVHEYPDLSELEYCLVACDGLFDVMSNEDIHIVVCAAVGITFNGEKTEKQITLERAMRLYIEGRAPDADQEILKFLGNSAAYLNFEVFKEPKLEQPTQERIAVALTRMAYLLGSTDNVTAVFGLVKVV